MQSDLNKVNVNKTCGEVLSKEMSMQTVSGINSSINTLIQ